MVKIDLITGFLGSGKTTFIRKYATYLMEQGMRIGILENDFGAVNVDMMLLQDLVGEQCDMEMVAGGCDIDCHRRRFKTKLIAMGMLGYDRVIVEPSGIFDVDEFFDILHEEPIDRWFEAGSVITILDGDLEMNLNRQSRFILASQLASAGTVLVSKFHASKKEKVSEIITYSNQALEEVKCKNSIDERVLCKNWDELSLEDFEKMMNGGYQKSSYEKLWFDQNDVYSPIYIMNKQIPIHQLVEKVEQIFKDKQFGDVFRIKGFMRDELDDWMELNATSEKVQIQPIAAGQDIIIVIGSNLNEDMLQHFFD